MFGARSVIVCFEVPVLRWQVGDMVLSKEEAALHKAAALVEKKRKHDEAVARKAQAKTSLARKKASPSLLGFFNPITGTSRACTDGKGTGIDSASCLFLPWEAPTDAVVSSHCSRRLFSSPSTDFDLLVGSDVPLRCLGNQLGRRVRRVRTATLRSRRKKLLLTGPYPAFHGFLRNPPVSMCGRRPLLRHPDINYSELSDHEKGGDSVAGPDDVSDSEVVASFVF